MRVSIIGCGYVGLVSGAGLAEKGHSVVCVDQDLDKVAKINAGVPPFYERGLGELLSRHVPGRLCATCDLDAAVLGSDLTLVAVGTPDNGRHIDLSAIETACTEVGRALQRKASYHLVVVKSTVVPGTTEGLVLRTLEASSGKTAGAGFGLGMNPEFLTEGQAVADFLEPDRIVIGGIDARSLQSIERLYDSFKGVPVLRTNIKTAEMIKYASNALLATMISFSNEFANLCSALGGIDVVEVMKGVNLSRYLTNHGQNGDFFEAPITSFLAAGCGFGGSCLRKDVKALIARGKEAGASTRLLDAVIEINERQPSETVAIVRRHFGRLENLRVAVLGLAFKPDTSDIRESPAVPIIRELLSAKAVVKAHDPVAIEEFRGAYPGDEIEFCDQLARAIEGVEAIIVVTRWAQFKALPEMIKHLNPPPLVVDARRMFERSEVARYAGVGLGD